MDNTGLYITLWVASGAFIGGVVTPLLTADKRFNDWLATLIGTITGAAGNLIALVPLWVLLRTRTADSEDTRVPWQRDAMTRASVAERDAQAEEFSTEEALAFLRANFWPQPRTDGHHSHRMTYVGVAAALAVLTLIEVALTFAGGPFVIGALVALSTIKVLLVVGFFMHLFYDSKLYAGLLLIMVPFAAMILIVLALA